MGASAPKGPALFRCKYLIGGTDSPFTNRLGAVFRGAEQRDGPGGAGKQTTQALGDEPKNFFAGSACLQQASQFADERDFRYDRRDCRAASIGSENPSPLPPPLFGSFQGVNANVP